MTPLIRRREPRVLALDQDDQSLAFVVADIHELRSSGDDPTTTRARRVQLTRLIRRERPTAIVSRASLPVPKSVRERIPLVPIPRRLLPFHVVSAAYPEAATFAPNARLERLARIAVTTLIRGTFPPRRYEKHSRR